MVEGVRGIGSSKRGNRRIRLKSQPVDQIRDSTLADENTAAEHDQAADHGPKQSLENRRIHVSATDDRNRKKFDQNNPNGHHGGEFKIVDEIRQGVSQPTDGGRAAADQPGPQGQEQKEVQRVVSTGKLRRT